MHRRPVKGAAQHLCLVHVKAGQRADACPEALVQESQQVYNVLVAPVLQLARRHGLGQPRLGHLARQAQARAGEQVAQRKRADAEHLHQGAARGSVRDVKSDACGTRVRVSTSGDLKARV
eukprot:352986-Chlamydomonas_euryale.AAC.10